MKKPPLRLPSPTGSPRHWLPATSSWPPRSWWAGLKVVFYQGVEAIASVWPALTQAASDAFSYIGVNLGSLFSASAETFS